MCRCKGQLTVSGFMRFRMYAFCLGIVQDFEALQVCCRFTIKEVLGLQVLHLKMRGCAAQKP